MQTDAATPQIAMPQIKVSLIRQVLDLVRADGTTAAYPVSTSRYGAGELSGSFQTPRGQHVVRAMIGAGLPEGAVFVGRRFTGEIYSAELAATDTRRDWILTRILWLSGCERGFNRLGKVDSMRRFIYIHGTPDTEPMGYPASHGCVRMRNADLLDLFDSVTPGCPVTITEL